MNIKQTRKFDGALLDSIVLGVLLIAMCTQINLGDIGKDTTAQGYVTKRLAVALPDITLFAGFLWFAARTTILRAWSKVWWPPFPCFALLFCLVLSTLHSRPLVAAVAGNLAHAHGIKQMLATLKDTQESKEAIAKIVQFLGCFLVAPLLFVNLIHDRRSEAVISRRRMALTTFLWATLASIFYAFSHRTDLGFQGFFSSPNALSGFLVIALSLLGARLFWPAEKARKIDKIVILSIIAAFALVSSLWSVVALMIGLIAASTLAPDRARAARTTLVLAAVACVVWIFAPAPSVTVRAHGPITHDTIALPLRVQSARLSSTTEKVKKQYVEWFIAAKRLGNQHDLSSFATGVGPGNYQFNIGQYYGSLPNEEKMPPDSNNLYLVQAVSIGVLGLGALLWVVLHFGQIAWRARQKFRSDWLAAGVLASLAAWLFVNCFHALIVRGTGTVFAFMLALAVIAWQRELEEKTNTDIDNEENRNFVNAALS